MYCITGPLFIIGLIALIKGNYRAFGRDVPSSRGRLIGLVLMIPLIAFFAYSFLVIGPIVMNQITTNDYGSFDDLLTDPSIMTNPAILNSTTIDLVTFVVATGLALYLILSLPQSGPAVAIPRGPMPGYAAPTTIPAVMTAAEAAAYLRISEFEVIALIEEGKLPAARIGGEYRIARIAVDDFLRSEAGQQG